MQEASKEIKKFDAEKYLPDFTHEDISEAFKKQIFLSLAIFFRTTNYPTNIFRIVSIRKSITERLILKWHTIQ